MNFLFWNTNKKDNNYILKKLITKGDCDFIGLAEYNDLERLLKLKNKLNSKGLKYYILPDLIDKRLNILSKYEILSNDIFTDSKYYRIVSIRNFNGEKILIAVVHFPSKLYAQEASINSILRNFIIKLENAEKKLRMERFKEFLDSIVNIIINEGIKNSLKLYKMPNFDAKDNIIKIKNILIKEKEKKALKYLEINKSYILNRNTIVMGDFNINPFETSMVNADTLHALSSKSIARKINRTVYEKTYNMFYNPMWNMLGDENGNGSYYYNSSQITNYYWNILDQFIVRPEIADKVNVQNIKIITNVDKYNLKNNSGIPNKEISDHFPLYFKLEGI